MVVFIIVFLNCFFNLLLGYGFKKTDMIDLYNQYDEKKDDRAILSEIVGRNFITIGYIGIVTSSIAIIIKLIFKIPTEGVSVLIYVAISIIYIVKMLMEQRKARKIRKEKIDNLRKEYYENKEKL